MLSSSPWQQPSMAICRRHRGLVLDAGRACLRPTARASPRKVPSLCLPLTVTVSPSCPIGPGLLSALGQGQRMGDRSGGQVLGLNFGAKWVLVYFLAVCGFPAGCRDIQHQAEAGGKARTGRERRLALPQSSTAPTNSVVSHCLSKWLKHYLQADLRR